jgi:hypothetical protein
MRNGPTDNRRELVETTARLVGLRLFNPWLSAAGAEASVVASGITGLVL